MAPFQGPGVRPDVLIPKNVWFCLLFAQKALKRGFSAFGEGGGCFRGTDLDSLVFVLSTFSLLCFTLQSIKLSL